MDAVEEAEHKADLDEPFTADWPLSGRSAYLRSMADDPYEAAEFRNGAGTQIVVSVPFDSGGGWIIESREPLAAARAALGVDVKEGTRP
ncbi:hypothetical protein [Streptomyces sp. SID3343]|uniref:hypothetical protein n=1 Tax=Streptomyces sp. SID3343 TaxID=2690260 RepID=UPI001F47846A|nr:hypothetical protein [Streptomyces sp. SID3343]